jgi:hypothetical protein
VIRRVLERIAAAPASERSDILTKLSVLSDLRGIGPRVQSEMERVGIPVNLEESTLVRATIDRVRQESVKKTSIDNIVRVLRSRFQDKLPTDLRERLDRYSQDELTRLWSGARPPLPQKRHFRSPRGRISTADLPRSGQ